MLNKFLQPDDAPVSSERPQIGYDFDSGSDRGMVRPYQLKVGVIGSAQIEDGAVTASKIASTAVTTGKIANSAVTNIKIEGFDWSKGTSGTLGTPSIIDFTNATHAHTSNATGGSITGGAGVTSVVAGTNLTGGTITSTGTIALAGTISPTMIGTTTIQGGTANSLFLGTTLSVTPPGTYSVTNGTIDRVYNAGTTSLDELSNVLYSLITDLKTLGLVG